MLRTLLLVSAFNFFHFTCFIQDSFSLFELDPYRPNLKVIIQQQHSGIYDGCFDFISAIKLDASGELLIGIYLVI